MEQIKTKGIELLTYELQSILIIHNNINENYPNIKFASLSSKT